MASCQTLPQDPAADPNSPTQNPNVSNPDQIAGALPGDHTQFPKTLSQEISNPNDSTNQSQDDFEEITTFSPIATTTTPSLRGGGPGRKNRKVNQKRRVQGKKSQKKLETLSQTLNPIPFVPHKTLDFASRETLLKKLGLWDFVHLQFDRNLRTDLIAQLIASYNPNARGSYVDGVKIMVNRADLGRALKLPVKKDKGSVGDGASEVESEDSIGFIEDLVSNWILLHEDTWMMPAEILNWNKVIKDGNFERVDWAGMIWFMVEKELNAVPSLGDCYYASHLQCLIKCQREELLGPCVTMEIDVKEDEEEEAVKIEEGVKTGEEFKGSSSVLEEHAIELSLGGMDNVRKEERKEEADKEGKENEGDADLMDFEQIGEKKEEEEHCGWGKVSMDGHFLLRPCSIGQVEDTEGEEERKQLENENENENEHEQEHEHEVEGEAEAEAEAEEEGKGEDEGGDGEEEEEDGEEDDDIGFHISPKGNILDGSSSEPLLEAMEAAAQVPFNVSSAEFLVSRVDTGTIAGASSLFGNIGGSKRPLEEHLESDMPHHHSLDGGNKRMRGDGHWGVKAYSDFDMFEVEMQHMMGKARMMMEEKEQANQQMSMNLQTLYSELQRRETIIQQLHKTKIEEQQKSQLEVYRLEHELFMMANLLEGYRKALKETHKAFADYRAKCQLPEEPIYKDTGSGGLVLSTMELEKQQLKREEEERKNRLLTEKMIKDFEAEHIHKFDAFEDAVKTWSNRLLNMEKELDLLKEISGKKEISSKTPEFIDIPAKEEWIPAEESVPAAESVPVVAGECAPVEVPAEG